MIYGKHLRVSSRGIKDKDRYTISIEYGGFFENIITQDEFLNVINSKKDEIGIFYIFRPRISYRCYLSGLCLLFFRWVGGPETAIELQFNTRQKLVTNDIVSVTGKLKLNTDDVEYFN
ncbi:hypothetical protein [uncultured Algibacter sp.]|uniref:hypothetical protein n=1 Tax=uncultured Algibacter sp. TaxID=298659 RepID=UPI002610673E|nr:hypothetical protein [uncultured Algibacter sp.]